jgi:hypothetical protein
MEKISCTYRVINEKVLHTVEDRNILHTIKKRKAKWIGHILRRNCLLEHFIGKKDRRRYRVLGRQGRRRKQLLFDLKEAREYCKLKEETVDRAVRKLTLEEATDLS